MSSDFDLFLSDSAGSRLGSGISGGITNEFISYNVVAGNTYYVSTNIGYGTSNYNLAVTLPGSTSPPPPPAGDVVNGVSIGDAGNSVLNASVFNGSSTIKGRVGGTDTNDYYKFVASASGPATFSLTGLSADIDLYLLDSTGFVPNSGNNGGNTNELIIYNVVAGSTYYLGVNGEYGTSNYNLAVTLPALTSTISSGEIFRAEGRLGNESIDYGISDVGKIRVLADFSKAAYYLQAWETASIGGQKINDPSVYADTAHSEIIAQGWTPLTLNPEMNATSNVAGQAVTNQMAAGYYTNGNAAAFVARSSDAVVISFRGTNDNGANTNSSESINEIYPDKDDWIQMNRHYQLFLPLIEVLDDYVINNNIKNIYVTGHSLGGAMAIQYMSLHSGSEYEAVSFAAPPFATSSLNTIEYAKDSGRLIQIEVAGDSVPMTHEMGPNAIRPGHVIRFEGNSTMDRPDYHAAAYIFAPFWGNDENHSMDYYRQITESVDPLSWMQILNEPGDPEVLLGGQRLGDRFIVDGRLSGANGLMPSNYFNDTLTDPTIYDYDIFYGGMGIDVLTGGAGKELMLGGPGNDYLNGGSGDDTLIGGFGDDDLTGGTGADNFKFLEISINSGIDTIRDFQSGIDKIQIVSGTFENLPLGPLSTNYFIAGSSPQPINSYPVFLYNTVTGLLTFDNNGSTGLNWIGQTDFVQLVGQLTLNASDFEIVAS